MARAQLQLIKEKDMFGLVEFLGGSGWTAAVFLGGILAILLGIHLTYRKKDRRWFAIALALTLYALMVLAIRGIILWLS